MTLRKLVILGSGGEAISFALAAMRPGFATVLAEPDVDAAERARFFLGRMQGPRGAISANVESDFTSLRAADVVFEAQDCAAHERAQSLIGLATQLRNCALLITTNLSGFPSGIAGPQLVGFHLFAPAHIRRLVEITPGPETTDDTLATAQDFVRAMDRVPVLAPVGRASIGTRLERALYEAAERLLLMGVIPHELDEAMVACGFDMGLFEAQDLIGLDVAYADRKRTARPALVYDRMVQEGRLGKKVGVGWYRYPGGGGAVIDPLLEDLIREEARFAKVEMRDIGTKDIQRTLLQALADEGRALVADGTAPSAGDVDRVVAHGLGFVPQGSPAGTG